MEPVTAFVLKSMLLPITSIRAGGRKTESLLSIPRLEKSGKEYSLRERRS